MKNFFLLIMCALYASNALAQVMPEHPDDAERNKGNAILLHLTFGLHQPFGDMADRFGADGNFGIGLEYLTANNMILGVESQYLFGPKVKEDPLAILRTPEGDIIGNDRILASVALRKRGYYLGGMVGKLFTFNEKRSGIRLTLGAGLLRHWIRIQDDNSSVTELTGDYKKGYDRLTGGLALNQFIGWQHLAANRRSNWLIGLEFNEGFTNTLRDWDFNDKRKLDDKRLDLRIGVRIAWTLPFYQGKAEEIYY
ncbi:MAG: hypothetical protein DYG98_14425 [Haliscomenobacteraceae bacterium CHB4]|nr:hypothetical protein [Saprospiraceae bacterium]MCE7924238.1 hypothetical protein [Haliscomenobacteraceae bacterium CHB4]